MEAFENPDARIRLVGHALDGKSGSRNVSVRLVHLRRRLRSRENGFFSGNGQVFQTRHHRFFFTFRATVKQIVQGRISPCVDNPQVSPVVDEKPYEIDVRPKRGDMKGRLSFFRDYARKRKTVEDHPFHKFRVSRPHRGNEWRIFQVVGARKLFCRQDSNVGARNVDLPPRNRGDDFRHDRTGALVCGKIGIR